MIERLDYASINGPAIAAMAKAKNHMGSIDEKLRAVVELLVSQINGCVYCVDLHTTQAREAGETQQRLDTVMIFVFVFVANYPLKMIFTLSSLTLKSV